MVRGQEHIVATLLLLSCLLSGCGVNKDVDDGTCVVQGTQSGCVSFQTGACDIKVTLRCTKIKTPGAATQIGDCSITSPSDVQCPPNRIVDYQAIKAVKTTCNKNHLLNTYNTNFDKVCIQNPTMALIASTASWTPLSMGTINNAINNQQPIPTPSPTYPPTYLPTDLPTFPPTYPPTYLPTTSQLSMGAVNTVHPINGVMGATVNA